MQIDQRMARVFVTQEMPFNYAPAEEYGTIVFCTLDDIRPTNNSLRNERTSAAMALVLADYVPGFDYLLPSGSPLNTIVAVGHITNRVGHGHQHNVLKWDAQRSGYSPVFIKL